MKLPLSIDDLNEVGTDPDQAASLSRPAAKGKKLGVGSSFAEAPMIVPTQQSQALAASIFTTGRYETKYAAERNFMIDLWQAGEGNEMEIECHTQAEAVRRRMRFYRCKDELRKRGNENFNELVLQIRGTVLVLTYPRSLEQMIGVIKPIEPR